MTRLVRVPLDFLMAATVVATTVVQFLTSRSTIEVRSRGLIVFDTSYSLAQIQERELLWSITARGCNGFFDHVWSIHPLAGADGNARSVGALQVHELADGHTFVEAHLATGKRWSRWPITGFSLSQRAVLKYLRTLAESGQVAAIRVGDPYYLGLLGYLLSRAYDLPLTLRVASDYDAAYEKTGLPTYPRLLRFRRLEKWIEKFVFRRSKLVVAPNHAYRSFAISNGARPERCEIIPFGGLLHPVHFEDPSSRPNLRTEILARPGPLLVSVMRLEPVKHATDLVDVLSAVRQSIPEVLLAVAGDGSQYEEICAKAEQLGVADSLLLLGNRGQEWIAALLASADVIVAPMMGRALVEAALSGTPIVAYDVDWHEDLIEEGETGRLVPFGDSQAMAGAVIQMLADTESSRAIGQAARADAMETMDRTAVIQAEAQAWRSVIGE